MTAKSPAFVPVRVPLTSIGSPPEEFVTATALKHWVFPLPAWRR